MKNLEVSMDINTIFEEEIKQQIREKLQKYTNKVYLDNSDIVKELNISSADNLRRQLYEGKYKGLYEDKKSPKEPYRWNKFRFFKWYFNEQMKALGKVC